MKNYLQALYDEHLVIVNAIDAGRLLRTQADADPERYDRLLRQLLFFFRQYADGIHHQKEESILFPEMNKRNDLLGDGIVKEMYENHERFRDLIRNMEKSLDVRNVLAAAVCFEEYAEALLDHIAVENEEVFRMAGTLFNELELERMAFRFEDIDQEAGAGKKEELTRMVNDLRKELVA